MTQQYLGIIEYTSVDQDGRYPIERKETFLLQSTPDTLKRDYRNSVRERLNGKFMEGKAKCRLFEIKSEITVEDFL